MVTEMALSICESTDINICSNVTFSDFECVDFVPPSEDQLGCILFCVVKTIMQLSL